MKQVKSHANKFLKAAVLAQCLVVPGFASAAVLFKDDFQTGYSWSGSLLNALTSQSTVQSQMASKWQYIEWATGHGAIDVWPADPTKRAYRIQYVNSEDLDVIEHKFDPAHTNGTGRPTEIYVQWKEYRSSTFDCGPSKDWRVMAYRANEYRGQSYPFVDIYGGVGNQNPSGINACTGTGIFIQGYGASQPGGDPNTITATTNLNFPRGTVKTIELHLKMNTPNTANGAAEMWVDGTKIIGRTDVKFSPDGWPQIYIDGFQLGMSATNGGQSFAALSYIWRTDFIISSTYIGTGVAATPPATPSAPAAPSSLTVQSVN